MGLFSFLAETTAEVIGEQRAISRNNKIIAKKQQQLQEGKPLLDQLKMDTIMEAKQTAYKTRLELYRKGISALFDLLIDTCKTTNKKLSGLYFEHHHEYQFGDLQSMTDCIGQLYSDFFDQHRKLHEQDKNYTAIFEEERKEAAKRVKEKITSKLIETEYKNFSGKEIDFIDNEFLLLLLYVMENDEEYLNAAKDLDRFNSGYNGWMFTTLHEIEYGKFENSAFDVVPEEISKIKELTQSMKNHITDNESGYFEGIRKYLTSDLLWNLGTIMWWYANRTPFLKDYFYQAVGEYNEFRSTDNAIEAVLADIYVKNKLGGEDLVRQNIDEIMEKTKIQNPGYARGLSSFLAYLGAYQTEYEVLKKAVEQKIQLNEEMQNRLNFLAKGGTSNKIKVYEPIESSDFLFDSSTDGWKMEEFETLLSKIKMERKQLKYSLTIKSWKKAIPLAKNKKFSKDALHEEFLSLVEDFDGEVEYKICNASAVNADNIWYADCAVFHFTTERNRGLSILFTCEKFGRNLNIAITTLFTPSNGVEEDKYSKYIMAILNNSYVDSFTECILQAVDEAMKEKEDIYGDGSDDSSNQKMFE